MSNNKKKKSSTKESKVLSIVRNMQGNQGNNNQGLAGYQNGGLNWADLLKGVVQPYSTLHDSTGTQALLGGLGLPQNGSNNSTYDSVTSIGNAAYAAGQNLDFTPIGTYESLKDQYYAKALEDPQIAKLPAGLRKGVQSQYAKKLYEDDKRQNDALLKNKEQISGITGNIAGLLDLQKQEELSGYKADKANYADMSNNRQSVFTGYFQNGGIPHAQNGVAISAAFGALTDKINGKDKPSEPLLKSEVEDGKKIRNYIASDTYYKRLLNFRTPEDARNEQKTRLGLLDDIKSRTEVQSDVMSADTGIYGAYISPDIITKPKIELSGDRTPATYAHELIHASTSANDQLNNKEKRQILNSLDPERGITDMGWDYYNYVTDPTEYHARLNVLRKYAVDKKIHKNFGESFTKNQLEKLMDIYDNSSDKEFEDYGDIQDLLQVTKDKKHLLKNLNTIADVVPTQTGVPGVAQAKQGGLLLPNLQNGGTTQDSLSLYKAMLKQQEYLGVDNSEDISLFPDSFNSPNSTYGSLKNSLLEDTANAEKRKKDLQNPVYRLKNGITKEEADRQIAAIDKGNKLANYYKSLPFNDEVTIGNYDSADIIHKTIKPTGTYLDGVAYSPVYEYPSSLGPVPNNMKNKSTKIAPRYLTEDEYKAKYGGEEIVDIIDGKPIYAKDLRATDAAKLARLPILQNKELDSNSLPSLNMKYDTNINYSPKENKSTESAPASTPIIVDNTKDSKDSNTKTIITNNGEQIQDAENIPNIKIVFKKSEDGKLIPTYYQNSVGDRVKIGERFPKGFQYPKKTEETVPKIRQGGQIIPTSPYGQYQYPGQIVDVPTQTGDITMKGVSTPLLGIGLQSGEQQLMQPGQEYQFKKDKKVREIPMPISFAVNKNPYNVKPSMIAENGGYSSPSSMRNSIDDIFENGPIKKQEVLNKYIPYNNLLPVQTEVDELIAHPTGDVTPVSATKRHKDMDKDQVTDFAPEGAYIMSQYGRVSIKKSDADKIITEIGLKPYELGEVSPQPKQKTLGDFMTSKKMSPADLTREVIKKFKVIQSDDPLAILTNQENKINRKPYLEGIIALAEADKQAKGIGVPIMKDGGEVYRQNIPHAQDPLSLIPSAIGAIYNIFAGESAKAKAEKLRKENIGLATNAANQQRGYSSLSALSGIGSLLGQNTNIEVADRGMGYLDQMMVNTPGVIRDSISNQAYANIPTQALAAGTNSFANYTNALQPYYASAAGAANKTAFDFYQADRAAKNELLAQKQAISDFNAQNRVSARNQMTSLNNQRLSGLGSVLSGKFGTDANIAQQEAANKIAANSNNTAQQIAIQNGISQTVGNFLNTTTPYLDKLLQGTKVQAPPTGPVYQPNGQPIPNNTYNDRVYGQAGYGYVPGMGAPFQNASYPTPMQPCQNGFDIYTGQPCG